MKIKFIENVSYDEFSEWANRKAATGQWGLETVITALNLLGVVDKAFEEEYFLNKIVKKDNFFYSFLDAILSPYVYYKKSQLFDKHKGEFFRAIDIEEE